MESWLRINKRKIDCKESSVTQQPRFLTLQRLIVVLATLSALVMLGNALTASYRVQRQQLIDSTLESNRVYARKLAQTTHHFLTGAQQQLAYSATQLGSRRERSRHSDEAQRLHKQTGSFNSVLVVDGSGRVLATSPLLVHLNGTILKSAANHRALELRTPLVSDPYVASTGRLIVTLSHPVFDTSGNYAGYITASIHLKEKNILHTLLGEHFYRDGSYLYVVGRDGSLLYHPERERVGHSALRNAVVEAVSQGKSGAQHTVNSHGIHMLAGFAPVANVDWGVVAQRPIDATLAPLEQLMRTVLFNAAPLGLACLVVIWFFARRIALPLWQLALNTQAKDIGQAITKVTGVNSWYYEAAQLRRAVLISFKTLSEKIGRLDRAVLTDPLTGLLNRRGLERALSTLQESSLSFGIVAFDVDHFKAVNDQFGHQTGDEVIAGIGLLTRRNARSEDILCRIGGEEFLLLIPSVDAAATYQIADRLRQNIGLHYFEGAGHVSISAGVAHFPETETDPSLAIRQADKALYQAKRAGRNRVIVYRKRSQA